MSEEEITGPCPLCGCPQEDDYYRDIKAEWAELKTAQDRFDKLRQLVGCDACDDQAAPDDPTEPHAHDFTAPCTKFSPSAWDGAGADRCDTCGFGHVSSNGAPTKAARLKREQDQLVTDVIVLAYGSTQVYHSDSFIPLAELMCEPHRVKDKDVAELEELYRDWQDM